MNCTQVLDAVEGTFRALGSDLTAGKAIAYSVVLGASIVVLLFGHYIIRTATVAICTIASLWITITTHLPLEQCELKLAAIAIAGVVGGGVAYCVVRQTIVLLGAAGLALLAHTIYRALLPDDLGYVYWIVLGVAAAAGVVLFVVFAKVAKILATSCIGACGTAICTWVLSGAEAWIVLPIVCTLLPAGAIFQSKVSALKLHATKPVEQPPVVVGSAWPPADAASAGA